MRLFRPAVLIAAAAFLAGGVQAESTAGGSTAGTNPVLRGAPAPQPTPIPAPAAAPAQAANYFNPAISVFGNCLAVGGSNPVENLPSDVLDEMAVDVLSGDPEGLLVASKRRDPAYSANYRVFADLSQAISFDLDAPDRMEKTRRQAT